MSKDIQIAYREVLNGLRGQLADIGEKVYEFSNDYSEDDEVHFRSLLLREDARVYFDNPDLKKGIIAKMDSLVREVYDKAGSNVRSLPGKFNVVAVQSEWLDKRKPRETVFTCSGVNKQYQASGFRLQDISLSLKEGEITGVVGENGNGKTTLLKIIAGELFPENDGGILSYGSLQSAGEEPDWFNIKPRIAYLPQELGRLVGSVKRSIQYSAALHGIIGKENEDAVHYIIERLGLGKYKDAVWQELSGGYKLRFALARILVWKPRLMVLDEPLANLDINTQIRVLNDLRDLCKSIKYPISIIMSSQNIEEIEEASDNMIVLKEGKIVYQNATPRIGEERRGNIFEFRCQYSQSELEYCLNDLGHTGLAYNGFTYFITLPLKISALQFLRYCSERNITLSYFQDISMSTKRWIAKTDLSDNL
ncbi:MAG TPA: ABC transporter ATP-binding protein [Puia sp.]|jgi:ABC-type multidrug transport system ATPase subunit|nr:ABC transporter ATP-binding protein [Puia sp.]